jgi:DNA polymerase-3 subunit delta
MNTQVFRGGEAESREVALAAAAFPLLGSRRLVVVREAGELGETGPLEEYLRDPSPTTTLLLIEPKPDFRLKLFQLLKERAVLVECRTPYDDRITGWIEAEVRSAGKTIDPEGAELLRMSAGPSLAEVANELEKLYTYAGDRKHIGKEDVAAVVGISRQATIFDLQRALGRRDARSAFAAAGRMIDAGENMTRCVAQLTHWLEKIWLLPEKGIGQDEAAALIGVRPFFAGEFIAARRAFPASRLDECFLALREADLALKTSAAGPRQVITGLIHAFTRKSGGKGDDPSGE